jgi:hypothetical protein
LKKAYVIRTLKSFVKAGPSSSLKHGMLLSVRTTSFSAAYRQAHSHTCTHTHTRIACTRTRMIISDIHEHIHMKRTYRCDCGDSGTWKRRPPERA